MTDITQLKRMLHSQMQSVAQYLLPRGRREGREWVVGSIDGDPGKSLKVCISGSKQGCWSDFAAGGDLAGDAIDLWRAVRRLDLPEALEEIRKYLSIEEPSFEREQRVWRRPDPPKAEMPVSAVKAYLMRERMISMTALVAYRIGEQGRRIVFSSYVGDELCFVKYLSVDRRPDGKKITSVEAECEPVLFGWQAVPRNGRSISISEGEIDAMSLFDYGRPALSVPFGGGTGNKQRWIESEFARLQQYEMIYLVLDGDDEGEAAAQEIANRLGRHRCFRVRLPRKDANECRKAGITREQIEGCYQNAETMDPPELRRAGSYAAEVEKLFWPPEGREPGYRMPFGKIRELVVFRPGELTLWTGETGSGKSQILGHVMVEAGSQGARVCCASFEFLPKVLLKRIVKQSGNIDRPTPEYINAIMGWLNDWLFMFSATGKRDVKHVLDVFEYARAKYGCDVFVIDSLMRLGIAPDDYAKQEQAVFQIVNWTNDSGVHTHLVAHQRKGSRDNDGPGDADDVKGTSEIIANAHNGISVWRNRRLEEELVRLREVIAFGGPEAEQTKLTLQEKEEKPPVILSAFKQRNGDWEGRCGLWFNRDTYQYRSAVDAARGKAYVDFSTQERAPAPAEELW